MSGTHAAKILAFPCFLFLCSLLCGCKTNSIEKHPEHAKLEHEVETVIQTIREATGVDLYSRLQRLVAYNVFAIDPVCELAEDPNARIRSNAIWVLGQIRDIEYPVQERHLMKTLRNGIEDSDQLVRYESASALLVRGQWDVIPMLIDGLNKEARDSVELL